MLQLFRVCLILFLVTLGLPCPHAAASGGEPAIRNVLAAELPPEGRETLRSIARGGPFKFSRDGVVFANYEGILPKRPRGFYHEYTVPTPGKHARGIRRIVCGPPSECYYTADHYQSFRRIRE
ncbi:MAG: ribonuclease domain-containing protein [Gallionella sp.]